MFLLNSRGARFAAAPSGYKPYRGTPSSEVTELICLVPERVFSQAPLDIHLVYLCRFGVRLRQRLLSGFSWQREITDFTRQQPVGPRLRVGFEPRLSGLGEPTVRYHPASSVVLTYSRYPGEGHSKAGSLTGAVAS